MEKNVKLKIPMEKIQKSAHIELSAKREKEFRKELAQIIEHFQIIEKFDFGKSARVPNRDTGIGFRPDTVGGSREKYWARSQKIIEQFSVKENSLAKIERSVNGNAVHGTRGTHSG